MTGIIRIGVTERGSFKKIFGSSSKAMHGIKLPLTYSEFTVHMQNKLKAGSFVGKKRLGYRMTFYFSLMHVL